MITGRCWRSWISGRAENCVIMAREDGYSRTEMSDCHEVDLVLETYPEPIYIEIKMAKAVKERQLTTFKKQLRQLMPGRGVLVSLYGDFLRINEQVELVPWHRVHDLMPAE